MLVVLGLTFFALAALFFPAQADAQTFCAAPGCRPLCVAGEDQAAGENIPLHALTVAKIGAGDGTFVVTALNPYKGASYNTPENKIRECATKRPGEDVWDVKHWCTFHCEHRHYFVTPGGRPQPATAWTTATADGTSFFLGWTADSSCVPPAALIRHRLACVQVMNQPKTITADFAASPDTTQPSAPVIEPTGVKRNTVTFAITTPAADEWLYGYEVHVNDELRTRVRADATTFTIANLLCSTSYAFQVKAYDSAPENDAPSNVVNAKTNACPKVPPNGVFHLKPPRRTKQKSAFFHWGARRGGVDLPQGSIKSKCRLDKRKWVTCSAVQGKTVRKLKPRWHTFRVRVGDAQGWDQTPAVWRWRVRR